MPTLAILLVLAKQ